LKVEGVRLRLAAAINMSYALFRALAGLLFIVIVTRSVSLEEFALYGVSVSLASILGSLVLLWSFWASRASARGLEEAPATGLALTLAYAISSVPLYIGFSYLESTLIGYGFETLLFGSILAPALIVAQYSMGLSAALRPQVLGYSGFLFDVLRLLLASLLVYYLGYGVPGALTAVALAYYVSSAYVYLIALKRYLAASRPSLGLARKWLASFKTPLAQLLYTFLIGGVVALSAPIIKDSVAVAYLSVAALVYQPLLSLARLGSLPLYARTLRAPSASDLSETLRIMLFTIVFLGSSAIYLARPIASFFGPEYTGASLVVPLAIVFGSLMGLANVYRFYVMGSLSDEGRDRELLSKFLWVQPLSFLSYIAAALLGSSVKGLDPQLRAAGVVLGLLVSASTMLAYNYAKARSYGALRPPLAFTAKTLLVSVLLLGLYGVLGARDVIIVDFTSQAPTLAIYLASGFALYVAVLSAIDGWVRSVIRRALTLAIS